MDTTDYITDDLLKVALQNNKGEDAELLSYELKPLTNKGDNYIGFIITVLVKYLKEGNEYEESYIAKLNPKRPFHALTEMYEECFCREIETLSTIAEGMNEQLKNINLPPIKTPKIYAKNLEKGREVFIDENLDIQGYKIFDLKNGLDMKHSQLALKEIGRLHAASLLYEAPFYPKKIQDLFTYFKEPRFDSSHISYKMIDAFITSHTDGVYNFLKKSNIKYEKAVKWLDENRQRMIHYFNDDCSNETSFNVLLHGDCHANNMLFRYDENNIPVDVRLLDLQFSRKASPASDLNYFFYANIDFNLRMKEKDRMLATYFESFEEVLKSAGKESPFSYQELVLEVKKRRFFGLSCALFTLPIYMVNSIESLIASDTDKEQVDRLNENESNNVEAMMERGGPLQDRLLSVFEELIDDHLFD